MGPHTITWQRLLELNYSPCHPAENANEGTQQRVVVTR